MDYEWFKLIVAQVATHGPWALLAWYLVMKLIAAHRREADALHAILNAYNTVTSANTQVTERLAVIIEERTRARNG